MVKVPGYYYFTFLYFILEVRNFLSPVSFFNFFTFFTFYNDIKLSLSDTEKFERLSALGHLKEKDIPMLLKIRKRENTENQKKKMNKWAGVSWEWSGGWATACGCSLYGPTQSTSLWLIKIFLIRVLKKVITSIWVQPSAWLNFEVVNIIFTCSRCGQEFMTMVATYVAKHLGSGPGCNINMECYLSDPCGWAHADSCLV